MKRSRFAEQQVIDVLQEYESGAKHAEWCRKYATSADIFCTRKSKFSGMPVPDDKRLRALEGESCNLKKLLAEQMLDARWSLDFVREQLASGQRFSIPNIMDEVTR